MSKSEPKLSIGNVWSGSDFPAINSNVRCSTSFEVYEWQEVFSCEWHPMFRTFKLSWKSHLDHQGKSLRSPALDHDTPPWTPLAYHYSHLLLDDRRWHGSVWVWGWSDWSHRTPASSRSHLQLGYMKKRWLDPAFLKPDCWVMLGQKNMTMSL